MLVLQAVDRACRRLGIHVTTTIGEFLIDESRSRSVVQFAYDHRWRKRRTKRLSYALFIFAASYYGLVTYIKEDSAQFLPLINVWMAMVTSFLADDQKVPSAADRDRAIQLGIRRLGFDVRIVAGNFQVYL